MQQKQPNSQTRIYLVYDFEELCGVFSSLEKAREAVAKHLALVKRYTEKKARQMNFGEVAFEIFRDDGERRWLYALVAKTKHNGADLHRRKVVIYQYNMDEYYSMMKRFVDNGGNRLGVTPKGDKQLPPAP